MKSITATVWLLSDDTWMTEIHEQESVRREISEMMPSFFKKNQCLIAMQMGLENLVRLYSKRKKKKKRKEKEKEAEPKAK